MLCLHGNALPAAALLLLGSVCAESGMGRADWLEMGMEGWEINRTCSHVQSHLLPEWQLKQESLNLSRKGNI